MTSPPAVRLLRIEVLHTQALLRSTGGRQQLQRIVQVRKGHGVGVIGWHPQLPQILRDLRSINPKWAIAVTVAARHWSHCDEDLRDGRPLLIALQAPQTDADAAAWSEARQAIARDRDPTRRYTLDPMLPCWLDAWHPDVIIRWLGPPSAIEMKAACLGCGARQRCDGPADAGLTRPLPMPVSNQFDALEVEDGAAEAGDLRVQVGRMAGHVRHVRSQPGAVPIEEICRALDLQQLYLDVSKTARLDDFSTQTRLLRRGEDGVWRPHHGDPFADEESSLFDELAQLRGLIVDIGAGPVRYLEHLRAAINSGQARYLAVEPELSHICAIAPQLPGGHFARGVGEHLPVATATADAALMLRSFNHLREPERAIAEAARAVRPGGKLIAVDNVVFGLCRNREQVRRARAISSEQTPFEHYRNVNGDEAAALIEADAAWQVLRVSPVTAGRANQWLVVARRSAPADSVTSH